MKQSVEKWKEYMLEQIPALEESVNKYRDLYDEGVKTNEPQFTLIMWKSRMDEAKALLESYRVESLPTANKYASQYLWSDVHAYQVIEEKTPNLIVVRELDTELTPEAKEALDASFIPGGFVGHFDNSKQDWIYRENQNNPLITIRRHKDGKFYQAGDRSCPFVIKSHPYKFYDYNF